MSEPPARLVDLVPPASAARAGVSLIDHLIRPLGLIHGPLAGAAVEQGFAERLAGGAAAFTTVEMIEGAGSDGERELRSVRQVALMRAPHTVARLRLIADPRPQVAGLTWTQPRIMAPLPLSSERGEAGERTARAAIQRGRMLAGEGADILAVHAAGSDFGDAEEVERITPVIEALAAEGFRVAVASRRPMAMRAGARAGARLVIDAAPRLDDDTLYTLGDLALPVILRYTARAGAPRSPAQVHIALETRIEMFEGAGVPRSRILVDPGLGAAGPPGESLALAASMALFHGLGCPLIADCGAFPSDMAPGAAPDASDGTARPPAAALAALALSQGAQLIAAAEPSEVWPAAAAFRALGAARFTKTG